MKKPILSHSEIIKLYIDEKLPLAEIERRAGSSKYNVRKILIAAGVPLRPRIRNKSDITREDLVRLHFDEGLGKMEIAARCGVDRATLLGMMRRHGIEPRRYSRRNRN